MGLKSLPIPEPARRLWACLGVWAVVVAVLASAGCAALPRKREQAPGEVAGTEVQPLPPDRAARAEALAHYATALSLGLKNDSDSAAFHFMRAAERDPDNEDLQLRVALELISERRLAEARKVMDDLARRRPHSVRALMMAGYVMRLIGLPENALDYYARAGRLAPKEPFSYIERAILLARLNRVEEAVRVLTDALEHVEDREPVTRLLTSLLMRRADDEAVRKKLMPEIERATRLLESLVPREPEKEYLAVNLGVLYRIAGRIDRTLLIAEQIERKKPEFQRWRFTALNSLLRDKDRAAALEAAQKLLSEEPRNTFRLLLVGHLSEMGGDIPRAMEAYERAAASAPGEVSPLVRLGLLLMSQQQADRGVETLSRALALRPDDPNLNELKAYAEAMVERFAESLPYFEKARRLMAEQKVDPIVPHFPIAHAVSAILANRPAEAAVLLRDSLKDSGNLLDLFARMILTENRPDRRASSVEALRKLAELEPKNPIILFYIGLVESQSKNYAAAVEAFSNALEIAQSVDVAEQFLTTQFYFWYGSSLERLGRIDEAAEMFKKAIAKEPPPARAVEFNAWLDSLNYLAYMWAERGMELEKGLELINRALPYAPDNAAYIDTRGWIYFMMGRYLEAREDLERAIALMPDDPTIADHLGDVYEKLGILEEAVDWWKKSFVLDPANEKVAEKLIRNGVDLEPLREEAKRRKTEQDSKSAQEDVQGPGLPTLWQQEQEEEEEELVPDLP